MPQHGQIQQPSNSLKPSSALHTMPPGILIEPSGQSPSSQHPLTSFFAGPTQSPRLGFTWLPSGQSGRSTQHPSLRSFCWLPQSARLGLIGEPSGQRGRSTQHPSLRSFCWSAQSFRFGLIGEPSGHLHSSPLKSTYSSGHGAPPFRASTRIGFLTWTV